MFVLLQPGKSDAAAVFGGGGSSTAFGPRGTQTVLAKITIGAAIVFFLTAFLFSIPGLFTKKSLGAGVKGASTEQSQPVEDNSQPPDSNAAESTPATGNEVESKPVAAQPGAQKPATTQSPAPKPAGK